MAMKNLQHRKLARDLHQAAAFEKGTYNYAIRKIYEHAQMQGEVKVYSPEEIAEYMAKQKR